MAGPTTTGLAALIGGEDWHYVGEAGEPAFENSWVGISGRPKPAFRIREAGIIDLQGVVTGGSAATIFTLPEGYRPSATVYVTTTTSTATSMGAGVIRVLTNGEVRIIREAGGSTVIPDEAYITVQIYLEPPGVVA